MNQPEIDKCKNDIVYFAEKYLGHELTTWQKTVLRFYHTKPGGMILFGQGYGKRMLHHAIMEHKKL